LSSGPAQPGEPDRARNRRRARPPRPQDRLVARLDLARRRRLHRGRRSRERRAQGRRRSAPAVLCGRVAMRLRQPILALGLVSFGILCAQAQAETYPTRPIRLISPFAAGGANDVLARALAAKLADRLPGSVVVENRPGAGAVIGLTVFARSA